jgi:hypothetical protein
LAPAKIAADRTMVELAKARRFVERIPELVEANDSANSS